MKKIIIDTKDLLIGFKEILSSIMPKIKSEKTTNNVSIELTSFESPNTLIILKLLKKISTDKRETTTASIMPVIPKKFPILEVSGDDNPLSARINNIPVIKNSIDDKLADIIYFSFFLFFYTFATFFA